MDSTGAVVREVLARRLAAAPVGVIEAPGGYGKTTLLRQTVALRHVPSLAVTLGSAAGLGRVDLEELCAHLARAARRSGWTTLARVLGTATHADRGGLLDAVLEQISQRHELLVVVVDEVQRATAEAATWLHALAMELPPGSALLAAGRRLPDALSAWPDQPAAVHIDHERLRFGRPEVGELLALHGIEVDDDLVDAVLAVTDGWPAAAGLAASLLDHGGPGLAGVVAGTGLIDSMLRKLLVPMPPELERRVRMLGHLPLLDPQVADGVAGPGALDQLIDGGIPWARRADGWIVVPDPVRDVLGSGVELDVDQRRRAAEVYRDRGQLGVGLTLLSLAGDESAVADLLASCSWRQLAELGLGPTRVMLERLSESELARHPGLFVRAARLAEQLDPALRRSWLERARGLAAAGHDAVTERAALAEMTRDAIRVGDELLVESLAGAVLSSAGPEEMVSRGRALAALGQLDTIRATPSDLAAAEHKLEEAALLFRLAGERELEADALLRLGYAVSFHGGNFARAVEQLQEVLGLLPAPDRARGDALTYLADVLDVAGRPEEAEAAAREALSIGRRIGDSWVVGAARWAAMLVAGHRGDVAGLRMWLGEVEQNPAPWMAVGAGVEFYADAADLLAANGEEHEAWRCYELARRRAEALDVPEALRQVEHRLEATFGDPVRAEALLVAAEGSSYAVQRNRWVRSLLRALAAHRRGDPEVARQHAERAVREAEQLGDAGIVWRLERRAAGLLAAYLPNETGREVEGWAVTLLGRFGVRRGGTDVTPPPGLPSTLVKLLALRGGMTIDEVVDQLWPESDLASGRARLRNLLNRLRERSGPLVVRHDGRLQLDASATVDSVRFERLAAEVLAAEPADRAGLARRCLSLHGGELLPGDRYEDWAAAGRERLRRRYVALVDLVIEDAIARDDLDEAVTWLDAAIEAEPVDERRHVTAAELLLRQGRRSAARAMVERGIAAVAELGVAPSPALCLLARDLDLDGR